MRRFTRSYTSDSIEFISNKINEDAEKFGYNPVRVSLVVDNHGIYHAITIFEYERNQDMFTKEQLANALRILNNECRSQTAYNQCSLYFKEYEKCALEMLDWNLLTDEIIDKVSKREMTKLEKAKEIIEKFYKSADCGLFNTRNIAGDHMENLYDDGELTINICREWMYFEVFGLNSDEFHELLEFYNELGERNG